MYTLSKIEKKYPPVNKFIIVLLSLLISLVLIISAVKFILNFTPIYKFDVNYLKITEQANMSANDILRNYEALISYLKTSYTGDLNLPTLPMSMQGKIHFIDVKNIFVTLDYILYISLCLSLLGILYCLRKKDLLFLRISSFFLILLPVLLAVPFALNFDASFTYFHKIFFRNDYWEFDPSTDPIINMLPQEFFFHCAVLILVIITIESIILFSLYRSSKKTY